MFAMKSFCVVSLVLASFVQASLLSSFLHHRDVADGVVRRAPVNCPQGTTYNSQLGTCQCPQSGMYYSSSGCTQCIQGNYCPDQYNMYMCPKGHYCNGGWVVTPQPCNPGTYAPTTGYGQNCANCPPGTWTSAYGSSTCCPCCENSFNANGGQTHCQACNNQGSAAPGATACTGSGTALPIPPAWCTNGAQTGPDQCPNPTGGGARKRSGRSLMNCPNTAHRNCPVIGGRGGFECVDVENDLESCGGCMDVSVYEGGGVDCTAIPGVLDVGCRMGKCLISKCAVGFAIALNGTTCAPTKQHVFGGETVLGRL